MIITPMLGLFVFGPWWFVAGVLGFHYLATREPQEKRQPKPLTEKEIEYNEYVEAKRAELAKQRIIQLNIEVHNHRILERFELEQQKRDAAELAAYKASPEYKLKSENRLGWIIGSISIILVGILGYLMIS